MDFEQLQDANYNIVDVAKPTGLCLLGVVVTSRPVDNDVGDARQDYVSSVDASACCELAEMVQPVESWAVEGLVDLENAF